MSRSSRRPPRRCRIEQVIDGKTLPRSFDRAAGRPALRQVVAFGVGARVAIGQASVAKGANETPATGALIETLALDGLLVTCDATHAQTETAKQVRDKGDDNLFGLKANRPRMLTDVAVFFADPPEPLPGFEPTDADHGRMEIWRHRVSHHVARLFSDRRYPGEPAMPDVAAILGDKTTRATRYYLSSAPSPPNASPKPCAPTGRSRTACTGCPTSPSTRIASATARTTGPRISPSCVASPSTSCVPRAQSSPSAENDPDGPTPSLDR